jgi:EAL domain-containing protein (putative c-di-GMP-specific phosphodiesterase class I)
VSGGSSSTLQARTCLVDSQLCRTLGAEGRKDAPDRQSFGASLQGRLLLAALAVLAPLLSAQACGEPARLVPEVTESSVMHRPDVTVPKLDRLSATGVRIALDDFGEGYSSLGQLRELPIDILKIARPFIREIAENSQDTALVRGII